jgi:hypothetical protein
MKYGCAHTQGLYNYPDDGNQFTNGCEAIRALGLSTLKIYLTKDYLLNYPLQSSWSSVPTTLTQLAQTTQFANQLGSAWDTVVMTTFTFANGTTNWWRVGPTNAQLSAEYTEIYNLVVHILTTYNNSGRTYIIQNWEGDWAFMDSFSEATFVDRKMVDYYSAFLAVRQKAVSDARRVTAHENVTVLNATEVNRVLDAKAHPDRRRIIHDLCRQVTPDMVSFSAYEPTIVSTGWGTDQADWEAKCETDFTKALQLIINSVPAGTPLMIGEFGFPENEATNDHPSNDVSQMILKVDAIASRFPQIKYLLYWQVFDNEVSIPYTYRGYWLVKPDGSTSIAGTTLQALSGGP